MRLFLQYLKGYQKMIGMMAVFCMIFVASFWLYHLPIGAVLYPTLLCMGIGAIYVLRAFTRVKHQHEAM